MFDGEALHKHEDFLRVQRSTTGQLNTLWLLREAGYQATWKRDGLMTVSYRRYIHSGAEEEAEEEAWEEEVSKQTFLKFVQSSLEGDISSIMPK
jgi:hypothetical protein